ncbi:MAG: hypothetical protein H0W53_19695 [Acidobacteria bacterium]|nr:hypothetical protein [Acidobacteriota bacterium]
MVPFTLIVFSKPPLGVCSRLAAEATRVLVLIRNVGFDARYARATPDHSRIVIRIPKDAEKDRGEIRLLFGWAKGLQSHRRRFVGGASAHLSEGDFGRAVEQLTKAVSLGGHQVFVADLASACSLAGKDDEAAAMLHQLLELRRQHCVPAICLARVYSRSEIRHAPSSGSRRPSRREMAKWYFSGKRLPGPPKAIRFAVSLTSRG